jgi:hypothetical protein
MSRSFRIRCRARRSAPPRGAIYLGEEGKLWRIDAVTGKRDEVTFSADIAFEFYPGSPPVV